MTKKEPEPTPTKKPWGDGEFDEEKAWALIQGLRTDKAGQASKLRELEEKLDAATSSKDSNSSDLDKLTTQVAKLNEDLAIERADKLRLEVATAKGLTAAQAKRLSGKTKEELEADADDLLTAFPAPAKSEEDEGGKGGGTGSGSSGPPSRRPAADLKGGTDPSTSETLETNPAKLAADLPRF